MAGVIFKGQDLKDLGFNAVNYDLSLIPIPKNYTESAAEYDGSYDFSEFNEDERIHYDDRNIMVEVDVLGKNLFEIERILADLSKLIAGGYGELVIPTMPTTVWTAKIESGDRINRDLRAVGITSIPFRAKPFAKHKAQTELGLRWEDCAFPWLEAGILTWDVQLDKNITIPGAQAVNIENVCDLPMRPVITVSGTFGGMQITAADGRFIRYSGSQKNQTIVFDFDKQLVTSNNSPVSTATGDFWEWTIGNNSITFAPISISGTVDVSVHLPYRYLYGARL